MPASVSNVDWYFYTSFQTVSSLQLTTSKSLVSDMESTNSSFILVLIASSAAMVAIVVLKITVDLLLRGRTRRKSAAILPKYKMGKSMPVWNIKLTGNMTRSFLIL